MTDSQLVLLLAIILATRCLKVPVAFFWMIFFMLVLVIVFFVEHRP
jgi:hypothetical protein